MDFNDILFYTAKKLTSLLANTNESPSNTWKYMWTTKLSQNKDMLLITKDLKSKKISP